MNLYFSSIFQQIENRASHLTVLKLNNVIRRGEDNSIMVHRLCEVLPHSLIETLDLSRCYFTLAEIKMLIDILPDTNIVNLILYYIDIEENGLALLMAAIPQTCISNIDLCGAKQIIAGLESLVEVIYQTKLISLDFDKYVADLFISQDLIDQIYLYFYNSNISKTTLLQILNRYNPVIKTNINDEYPPYSAVQSSSDVQPSQTYDKFSSKAVKIRESGLLLSMARLEDIPQIEACLSYLENYNIYIINPYGKEGSSYKGGYFSSLTEMRTNFTKWRSLLSDFYDDIKIKYNLLRYPEYNNDIAIIKTDNNWKLRYYMAYYKDRKINKVEKPEISPDQINIYLKRAVELFLFSEMARFKAHITSLEPGLLDTVMAGLI